MSATGYELQLLERDEETVVYSQQYAALGDVARAMLAAYDLNTEPGLLDENGELTMRVYGAGGRALSGDESESLFALISEYGGIIPRDEAEIAWLRLTNPERRS
jgi:hypothetical protein